MKPTTVFLLVFALAGTSLAIDSLNLRMIGLYHTDAYGVDVYGDYACISDFAGSLRVISVADPAHPAEVGHYDTTCSPWGLAIIDTDYVYMPDTASGVHVISIDSIVNSAQTVEVGFLNTPSGISRIAVAGQYAYMAAGAELLVVSVADPVNPAIVASCDAADSAVSNVAVSGNYAYVMDFYQGLKVISISDPLHPVVVGHCDLTGAYSVAVSDSYLCAGGLASLTGLSVISVADPAHPTKVGTFDIPGDVNDMVLDGNIAYVAVGVCGLKVVSIADPAHPLEVGYYSGFSQSGFGVALSDGYSFLADGGVGLLILQYYGSGVEESPGPQTPSHKLAATVIHALPAGAVVFDGMGRKVTNPRSGVLFVQQRSAVSGEPSAVSIQKVVLQR
jgi:hypothetical protein